MNCPISSYFRDVLEFNGLFYLLQNKIPFTMVDVDEQKPPDFENVSPLGSVPLLQDGNLNISGRYVTWKPVFRLADQASYNRVWFTNSKVIFTSPQSISYISTHNFKFPQTFSSAKDNSLASPTSTWDTKQKAFRIVSTSPATKFTNCGLLDRTFFALDLYHIINQILWLLTFLRSLFALYGIFRLHAV